MSPGIECTIFLVVCILPIDDWILTIFSRSFPLDVACRIWDCFLVDGSVFVFRAAIGKQLFIMIVITELILFHLWPGIIKMYGPALFHSSFEQCLNLLNHIPKVRVDWLCTSPCGLT